MGVIIALCLIGAIIYFMTSFNKDTDAGDVGKIDENFIRRTFDFYDGFESLCDNHSAKGVFSLNLVEENSNWAEFEMQCSFFSIDGEQATDRLNSVKLVYSSIKKDAKNWKEANQKATEYIKSFYCRENLNGIFTDLDEYVFEDNCVMLSTSNTLFKQDGAQINSTLSAIKQKLHEKNPNAEIKFYPKGFVLNIT